MLKFIQSVVLLLVLISFEAAAQKTTVWIVRHAEKDTSFANRLNPDLTIVGMQRAKDLAAYLKKENIVKIFSTDTKRTKQTATYFNMPIEIYNPKNVTTVLDFVNLDKQDKSVLIVGHSNTVLETIEALGGKRPMTQLSDDDYDYLFKVVLADDMPTTVTSFQFGQYHRGGNATMK